MLLFLLACAAPPECVDLREDPSHLDHPSPLGIALDVANRRLWAVAAHTGTLARIDPDTRTLHGVARYAPAPPTYARVSVDADGGVWIRGTTAPALVRRTVDGAIWKDATFDTVLDVEPVPGGAAVLGLTGSARVVAIVDETGTHRAAVAAPSATDLYTHGDELVVVGAELYRYGFDLTPRGVTALADPVEGGGALDDGAEVLIAAGRVTWLDGDGARTWSVGHKNADVVPWGDRAIIVDHESDDPTVSVAHVVGPDGPERDFLLGKNSAVGVVDPVTGLFWTNSEGSSEVLAFDPASGARVDAVRTGTWIDGLALHPEDPTVSWATGRLSDTVVRMRLGEVTARTDAITWPYSPVYDGRRDRLWVLAQLDGEVWGLDATTLEREAVAPLPVGPNPLYVFGQVILVPDEDALYAVESNADTLYRLDPDDGAVLASWPLGGPAVADPKAIGEVALALDPDAGALFLARSTDGRLQRFDLASEELRTTWLDDAALVPLREGRHVDVLRVYPDRDVVWFGGAAFDPTTLAALPARTVDVPAVIGPYRHTEDWLGLSDDGESPVRLAEGGDVRGELVVADREQRYAQGRVSADGTIAALVRPREALVCSFPTAEVR